jgi:hypothetical protein
MKAAGGCAVVAAQNFSPKLTGRQPPVPKSLGKNEVHSPEALIPSHCKGDKYHHEIFLFNSRKIIPG